MQKLTNTFVELAKHWDGLDGVVHSIGFAPAHTLDGDFTDVTDREGLKLHMTLVRIALLRWLVLLNHYYKHVKVVY